MILKCYYRIGLALYLFLYSQSGSTQSCVDTLFKLIDTAVVQLSEGAAIKLNQLNSSTSYDWVEVIEFIELDEKLSQEDLVCYFPLIKNPMCISFERFSYYEQSDGSFLWSGVNNETGESMELGGTPHGYGGYLHLCFRDSVEHYSFVGLSPTETAIVQFDSVLIEEIFGSKYCGIDTIDEEPFLYPNPVSNEIYIANWNIETYHGIEILLYNGASIEPRWELESNNKVVVDFSDLPLGIYIIRLKTILGDFKNYRVIKL